ncbi:MAG: hypothetical protein DWQ07_02610 [Chloroflexi bacterium]|nr:MAG: hypothetical protein DWQ07_02610 [Chloroflexota bacterium]MBL1193609.1 hypothetical protein [Chloroflexota bacterium]NOH10901.1 hypothetical protein [Chloroflexota bacterium]
MDGYRRDLRKYARQTNAQLFIGFFVLLLIVGIGLIYLFYGLAGAISGIICAIAALSPLVLIWLALIGIDWIVKRANEE